jgi:ribosomal-protein-alanine N-acetyltransferase
MSSENTFQVLKNDELIIGYYVASFAADECELLNITIKRDSQGKGFGKIALDHLINYCLKRETLNLFLEVRSSNKNAILLYENKGFNEVGIRPNYYKTSNGKEDAILMALSL